MKLKMFLVGLFLSLSLGIGLIVVQLRHNVQLRTIIEKKIQKEIQEVCNCRYKAELGTITFLNPSVTLENVILHDNDNKWVLTFDNVVCQTSWLSYIQYGTFLLNVTLNNTKIKTEFKGSRVDLLEHFIEVFQQKPSPSSSYYTPYKITISHAYVTAHNPDLKIDTSFEGKGTCFINNNNYVSSGTVTNGLMNIWNKAVVEKGIGNWVYNSTMLDGQRYTSALFEGTGDILLANKPERNCTIEATLDKSRVVHVYNGSTLDITYTLDDNYFYKGSAHFPCKYIQNFFSFTKNELQGMVSMTYEGDLSEVIHSQVHVSNMGFKNYTIPSIKLDFEKTDTSFAGTYTINNDEQYAQGNWNYDLITHNFTTNLANTDAITLINKDWTIEDKSLVLSSRRNDQEIKGEYSCILKHIPTDTLLNINGNYTYDFKTLVTQGLCNQYTFHSIIDTFPTLIPRSFVCLKEDKKPLINYQQLAQNANEFKMHVSYDLFYNLLEQFADYSMPGSGDLSIHGIISDKKITGSVETINALIRIPEAYNFLSHFKTNFTIQFAPFIIECTKLDATLHKGTIRSESLLFGYDADNFFMHLPFQFHKCLLNKKNSLLAQTSGSILLSKKRLEGPEFTATVIIEKGHLRENPFSLEGQQDVTSSLLPSVIFEDKPLNLKVQILTKEPLLIKTPQITSHANCNTTITNTLKEPHFKGTLDLLGGTIEFPYKPLTITAAHVYFVPNGKNDHQLEIVAQGVIKNYTVVVTVTGTTRDPHIALTSSPTLPEEQIISLLYTGSTQDSLNVIVPTFLTSNLQQRILGTAHYTDLGKSSWVNTLKRIHILPSFADQSGRGGFRGTVEIDISDRLRASLQKNFSLSEDTRIEVEYDITDDIVIKAIKDERSDIGAEVEMRFKF